MASWSLDAVGLDPALVTLGGKGERLNEVWPSSDGAADYGSEGRGFKSLHLGSTISYASWFRSSEEEHPIVIRKVAGSSPVGTAGFGGGFWWSSWFTGPLSTRQRVRQSEFMSQPSPGGEWRAAPAQLYIKGCKAL